MSPIPAASRLLAWDGLGLLAPADWQPARLGRGYLLLEDDRGPRLELRWQAVRDGYSPQGAARRLRRKWGMVSAEPGPAERAMLPALSAGDRALACRAGERSALLAALPGGLAVLASPRHRPEDAPELWADLAASLAAQPGLLAVYDIRTRIPAGFRLAGFELRLGHYRVAYAAGGDSLEFHRFAPAEVILRGESLASFAARVFAPTVGKAVWRERTFAGGPATECGVDPAGPWRPLRALAARVLEAARWSRGMAWVPDGGKILAVLARHRGGLSAQRFEEICADHVVVQETQA